MADRSGVGGDAAAAAGGSGSGVAPRAAALPGSGVAPGALGVGLLAAQAAFAATFRGPRDRFWHRMTLTGLSLGSLALLTSRPARRTRIGPTEVALGLASAATLYATFRVGDAFARRFVPSGDAEIRDIYTLRTLRPKPEIAARLATIIGPAEELFWRGLVQEALMARYGRWPGAAMAAMAYGGVHIVTGNFTLFGAAGIAGAHWCALYAAGVPLGALVVSHVTWDVWIFLIQPTGEIAPLTTRGRRHDVSAGEALRPPGKPWAKRPPAILARWTSSGRPRSAGAPPPTTAGPSGALASEGQGLEVGRSGVIERGHADRRRGRDGRRASRRPSAVGIGIRLLWHGEGLDRLLDRRHAVSWNAWSTSSGTRDGTSTPR